MWPIAGLVSAPGFPPEDTSQLATEEIGEKACKGCVSNNNKASPEMNLRRDWIPRSRS